jgi:uncharacterized protein (DUF1501 family)
LKQANHKSRRSFLNIGAGAAAAFGFSELLPRVSFAASGNRTVVCLYLVGGNDSNNMIVPLDSPAYDVYTRGRGPLALAKSDLLAVQSGPSARYGFHPNLPGLRDLYNQNALAVVANVGRVPGRNLALDSMDHIAEMQVRFVPNGYLAVPWAVSGSAHPTRQLVLPLAHGVSLAAPGADPARHRGLIQSAAAAPLAGRMPDTQSGRQLSVVLNALKTSGFSRQAFLVPRGGFETGQDQLNRQALLFAELDGALVAFQRALSDLGLAENVTLYTDTEFNRTLAPNQTGGSGHGWGGHHLVMGGSTLGGQVYGQFPSLEIGGVDDAARNGTWTPSTSSAQYAATLAYWYGVANLADVPEYAASSGTYQARLDFLAH